MGDERLPGDGGSAEKDPLKDFVDALDAGDPFAKGVFDKAFAEARLDLLRAFALQGRGFQRKLRAQEMLQIIDYFRLKLEIQDHVMLQEVIDRFEQNLEGTPSEEKDMAFMRMLRRRAYRTLGVNETASYGMTQRGIYKLVCDGVITVSELDSLTKIAEMYGISFAHI